LFFAIKSKHRRFPSQLAVIMCSSSSKIDGQVSFQEQVAQTQDDQQVQELMQQHKPMQLQQQQAEQVSQQQQQQQMPQPGGMRGCSRYQLQPQQQTPQQMTPVLPSLRQQRPPGGGLVGGYGRGSLSAPIDASSFNDDDPLEVAARVAPAAQAEPEPDASIEGPLSLSTRVEYAALPTGQTQDVFGLVSLQAAEAAPTADAESGEGETTRQPMDIACVLDVSGSMQGDKIRQVQDATRFIIEQSDPKDRLCMVSFNSTAQRVLRLRKMDVEGKNDANVATLRLNAGGGTSIAAGLDMALAVMERRRQRNKVSAILLLTDGQDRSTRGRIPELLRRAAAANCAVYGFGFGRDHDAALLSEIAEQAQTPFTFVEDTSKIKEAFAGAVGGLTSIVAQRVELSLKCQMPLKTVHTPFPMQRISEMEAMVTIPDMFAMERRDILVELSMPADGDGVGQTVLLEASARYTDLRTDRLVQTAAVVMEAQRVEEPQPEAEPDEEVSAQRERVEVTRALQNAAAASDLGQFDQALQVLDSCESKLKSSKAKSSPVHEALGQELTDARCRMCSRSVWEQGGRAEVKDATQMHQMQRCTNMMQSSMAPMKMSKAMYCNPTQGSWIQKSKGNSSSRG